MEDDLRAGRLVRVLTDWPCPGLPASVLYPLHRRHAPRVRVFIDWVAARYEKWFGPA